MEPIHYFAYGSNMLRERLLARKVVVLGSGRPACAEGYKLLFNKKSDDGSAKANLVAEPGSKCWGVIFSVDPDSLTDLDGAEGAPGHYQRANISVKVADAAQSAMTYIAHPDKILTVPDRPYDWYLALILAGATSQADMPADWITHLRKVGQPKPDTETPARNSFTEAIAQLKAAGHVNWQDLLNPALHPRPSVSSVVQSSTLNSLL
jgi:cation transport regulator ChaC